MALYKAIAHKKEHRKEYRKAKAFDTTCRNHGSCAYCYGNRTYSYRKRKIAAIEEIREYSKNLDN